MVTVATVAAVASAAAVAASGEKLPQLREVATVAVTMAAISDNSFATIDDNLRQLGAIGCHLGSLN